MIEERAVIVGMDALQPPLVWLEVDRKNACGLCGLTRGCGNKVWGKLFRHQQGWFIAKNGIQASIGQSVIVAIDERAVMTAALLVYLLPVISMLLLGALAHYVFANEMAALLGTFAGLLIAWGWLKGFLAVRPHGFSQPEIVRLAEVIPLADMHCIKIQSKPSHSTSD